MITVEKATRIAAPADRLWHLLSSREGQCRLERGLVASIDFEGDSVGMIRHMRLEGHPPDIVVKERLDLCDEAAFEMRLSIVDTGDIVPFACHSGYARIIPAGPAASILYLRTSFMPVDMEDDSARAIAEQNHDMLIANVRTALAEPA
jgi:hypothetical protein